MTIDEAIADCHEAAKFHEQVAKRCDDASEYTRSHNDSIRTIDAKKHEIRAGKYRQTAEWLKDYKRLLSALRCIKSLHQSRRILLMKGDTVLNLIEEIIDKHISEKEEE